MNDSTRPGYVELPGGKYAIITQEADLSERACRLIDAAMLKAGGARSAIEKAGLDPDTATLQQIYDAADVNLRDLIASYHEALIVNMVWEWDVQDHLPTAESVTEIPRSAFEILAKACNEEYNKAADFSPEKKDDPKAGGDS